MATEKKDPTASAAAAEKATAGRETAAAASPESPATGSATYHAPSQPDQASEADKDAADNPVAAGVEYAPDNAIESTVRRMAAEGATAGEIAAYRADALAKLGD